MVYLAALMVCPAENTRAVSDDERQALPRARGALRPPQPKWLAQRVNHQHAERAVAEQAFQFGRRHSADADEMRFEC